MIKVSAPEGAFSIVFEFKGYDIIFFSVPDTDTEMMCDMRVFKDGKDVSSEFTEILEPNADIVYDIMRKIDQKSLQK